MPTHNKYSLFNDIRLWQSITKPVETLTFASGKTSLQFHYHLEHKMGIRFLRNPALIPYFVPYWENKPENPLAQSDFIAKALLQLPACSVAEIHLHPDCGFIQVPGFTSEQRHTRRLTLTTTELLWLNLKPALQRQIKKGQKQLTIQTTHDATLLWQMHHDSLNRQGKNSLYTVHEFQHLLDYLHETQQGTCFVAYHHTSPCAAILIARNSESAYYLSGGSTTLGQTHGATSYLLWEGITDAIKHQCTFFDFEGSQHPGIDRFFSNFGAEKVPYTLLLKNKSLLFSLYRKVKAWLNA